jgi:hypothetical protein
VAYPLFAGAQPPTALPAAEEPGRRPATVTVAVVLQLVVVAGLFALAALTIVSAVWYDGVVSEAARATYADPEDVSTARTDNMIFTVLLAAPAVLVAALLAALAWPVWRGSNVVRIIDAVAAGLLLLGCLLSPCGPGYALIAVLDPGFLLEGEVGADFHAELAGHAAPIWLAIGMPVLALLVFAMAAALLVLLLVPPSNRFFRRRAPAQKYAPTYNPAPMYPYPYGYPPPGAGPPPPGPAAPGSGPPPPGSAAPPTDES